MYTAIDDQCFQAFALGTDHRSKHARLSARRPCPSPYSEIWTSYRPLLHSLAVFFGMKMLVIKVGRVKFSPARSVSLAAGARKRRLETVQAIFVDAAEMVAHPKFLTEALENLPIFGSSQECLLVVRRPSISAFRRGKFFKGEVFTTIAVVLMAEFASGFWHLVTCTLYPQDI
jgi:hypothetical protein